MNHEKAEIIARAVAVLDPAEARAAEALVLDRAGRLTPAGLRSAIAHAVIQVAPDKARERRVKAERDARVERWAEESGNAALVGRELPPAQVLAADQKISAWARQLKKAGLAGSMDELRARAYLDLLLGRDSRPRQGTPGSPDTAAVNGESRDSADGALPAGFAGKINLTIPLAALLDLADRPGEISGLGPHRPRVDPRPGGRRRPRPGNHLVRDRDRPRRPRDRPRLRTARTPGPQQAPGETRPAPQDQRRAGVHLHGLTPARPAGRIRELATAHRSRRTAGSPGHARPDRHQRV